MRPIIVPVDFSECSMNALEHALSIARKGGIDLKMLWVKKPKGQMPAFLEGDIDQVASVEKEFKKLVEKYQPTLPDSVIEYGIREGRVEREVVAEAEENKSFLVVTGTHGISGFEERWMGSNANKIVSEAPCPVITIREGVNINKNLERIIMPIDNTPETRQKVPFTIVLSKMFHAEIHVLVLYTTTATHMRRRVDNFAEQCLKYLMETKVPFKLEAIEVKNLVDDVVDYTRLVEGNLISVMSEMEKSTRNFWLGSYAAQLTNNSPYPVLVQHPKDLSVGTPGF